MQHMGLETKVIIPAGAQHLTGGDWVEIDSGVRRATATRAFPSTTTRSSAQLFARILNLFPEKVVGGLSGVESTTTT